VVGWPAVVSYTLSLPTQAVHLVTRPQNIVIFRNPGNSSPHSARTFQRRANQGPLKPTKVYGNPNLVEVPEKLKVPNNFWDYELMHVTLQCRMRMA